MSLRVGATIAAAALTALSACAMDDTDLESGTGSSGGNPVVEDPTTVSFQFATDGPGDTDPARTHWVRAAIHAATVSFGRVNEAGACEFDAAESWPLGAVVEFGSDQMAAVDLARLCRIRFEPPAEEPLVSARGTLPRASVLVTLWLPNGADLVFEHMNIDEGSSGSAARELVVAFEPQRLTDSVDLTALPIVDGQLRLSDLDPDLGARIAERFAGAIVVYLDPTPGDGRVTLEERTEANRVGHVEIVP